MQVTGKMREDWVRHREWGDYTKIAKSIGVTPATIQRIVEAKEPYQDNAPHNFIAAIQKFYNKRAKAVQKIMSEAD